MQRALAVVTFVALGIQAARIKLANQVFPLTPAYYRVRSATDGTELLLFGTVDRIRWSSCPWKASFEDAVRAFNATSAFFGDNFPELLFGEEFRDAERLASDGASIRDQYPTDNRGVNLLETWTHNVDDWVAALARARPFLTRIDANWPMLEHSAQGTFSGQVDILQTWVEELREYRERVDSTWYAGLQAAGLEIRFCEEYHSGPMQAAKIGDGLDILEFVGVGDGYRTWNWTAMAGNLMSMAHRIAATCRLAERSGAWIDKITEERPLRGLVFVDFCHLVDLEGQGGSMLQQLVARGFSVEVVPLQAH